MKKLNLDKFFNNLHVFFDFFICKASANQSFSGIKSICGIGNCLSFSWHSNQSFALGGKCNNRWRCSGTFGVFYHFGLFAFHDCHTGICCAQINTNHGSLDTFGHLTVLVVKAIFLGNHLGLYRSLQEENNKLKFKFQTPTYVIHTILSYKHHGKFFSTSGPYIFPKFQYQWSLCGP